jgi:hypothetical protein
VWQSDDNAIVRQKLRPGIADRIAPLLAGIIDQGVREGVFTAVYPEQTALVIVSLVQDLNDRLTVEQAVAATPTRWRASSAQRPDRSCWSTPRCCGGGSNRNTAATPTRAETSDVHRTDGSADRVLPAGNW